MADPKRQIQQTVARKNLDVKMISKEFKSQQSITATEDAKFENDKMRSTVRADEHLDMGKIRHINQIDDDEKVTLTIGSI